MLRILPLASDIKTVAIVRAVPAKQPRNQVAPPPSRRARRTCTPFPASVEDGARGEEVPTTSGTAPDSASPYRTGAIIAGKYRLMRQLGRGGMGEVWSAEHLELNTEVAVKFLSTGAGGDARRLALERFRFEAQVSAHLGQKTAHVVAVHDAGSDAASPYLVMEYVRGRTLRVELNRRGQLEPLVVACILDQVAEALSVAHAFGIVHRDLKPSNLLLVDQRDPLLYVKVADFGIAKAMRANPAVDQPEDTSDGWMLGSPAYMSPEQMSAGAVDPRTDMWALGVIAYEALTGRLPFPGRSVSEILLNMSVGRFLAPSKVCPSLPREIDDWCRTALSKKKEHRFRTMAEMAEKFRRAAEARPAKSFARVARQVTVAASLSAALLALRPLPSEALPEEVPSPLPTALAVPTARPGAPPPPQIADPTAAPFPVSLAGTALPSMSAGPRPASATVAPRKDVDAPRPPEITAPGAHATPATPAAPAKRRVLTEVF